MLKETRILMGMPITVELLDAQAKKQDLEQVFSFFDYVDRKFSTYKAQSEISQINNGKLSQENFSQDMKNVLALAEETKNVSHGYFDIINPEGKYDPSGLVKGWAIFNAAKLLQSQGLKNFYVEAGGDVQVGGKNEKNSAWRVGIKNPFQPEEIVKVIYIVDKGVATSGTYARGQHIYNPKNLKEPITEIISLTVIGPNIYEADRFATAAFAMGKAGINFIEKLKGFEGFVIDKSGIATMTSGFEKFTQADA